jgi:Protein of unknown function (DUF3800)
MIAQSFRWAPGPIRMVAVFECYFDDSGQESDRNNQLVVMAGYLAVDTVWRQFSELWGHLLAKHDLPHVHMKEMAGFAKSREWDPAKTAAVLSEFVGLIKWAPGLIGFGVAVDADAWRNLPDLRRNRFGSAQVFCCSRIIRRITDRLQITGGLTPPLIAIHFDQDFQFAGSRINLLEAVKKRTEYLRRVLTSVAFSNSDFYYPLQAADMLAWATRRNLMRLVGEKPDAQWDQFLSEFPVGEFEYAAGEYWDCSEAAKLDRFWVEFSASIPLAGRSGER